MQAISPTYSFVKFGSPEVMNDCCDGEQAYCIPVVEETDTYFQLKVTSEDYAETQDMMSAEAGAFHMLLLSGSGNTSENFTENILWDWTLQDALVFEKYRTGMFEITLQWKSAFKDIKTLVDCDNCFQLAFIRTGESSEEVDGDFTIGEDTVSYDFLSISNCFKRLCDSCYTSVLEYWNEEDYAEFNYCNITNPMNRVRLPFYLTQPKPVEDKTVYRKSNGAIKQTKSLLTKEYLVLTDYFPEALHDKVAVALAHDVNNVITSSYSGGLSKNGEYTIEWIDNNCTALASFKALATPFAIRNNNCQDCEDVELCSEIEVPSFNLPDANVGEAYDYTLELSGYQPSINDVVKPAWMTVTLTGSSLHFTGTPAEEAIELEVSFKLSNICTETITISKTINIENMIPGMIVMWSGNPAAVPSGWALCDGTGDTPDLSGMFIAGYSASDPDYDAIGASGGSKTHTLVGTEQGSMKFTAKVDDVDGGENIVIGSIAVNGQVITKDGASNQVTDGTEITVRLNNDAEAHPTRPPFYTLAFIIKTA